MQEAASRSRGRESVLGWGEELFGGMRRTFRPLTRTGWLLAVFCGMFNGRVSSFIQQHCTQRLKTPIFLKKDKFQYNVHRHWSATLPCSVSLQSTAQSICAIIDSSLGLLAAN